MTLDWSQSDKDAALRERITAMRSAGKKWREIAALFNVSVPTITGRAKKLGIPTKRSEFKADRSWHCPFEHKAYYVKMLRTGIALTEARATIDALPRKAFGKTLEWTPEMDDMIRSARGTGISRVEIAEALGVTYWAVISRCEYLGFHRWPLGYALPHDSEVGASA